jgi:hypothetical protein
MKKPFKKLSPAQKQRALNQVALSANETKTLTLQDRLEHAESWKA